MELLTALLFWLYTGGMVWNLLHHILILTCILIVTSAIDMEHQIIPNGLVLTGITAGIVFNLAGVGISFME